MKTPHTGNVASRLPESNQEWQWVRETLRSLGFQDVETCSFQVSRGGAAYSWVFARKGSLA
jgi:hypothetical protein